MLEKEVENLLRGGENTAAMKVKTDVYLHCGERLYSQECISRFEQIREKLMLSDTADFQPMGQSFQVV